MAHLVDGVLATPQPAPGMPLPASPSVSGASTVTGCHIAV
jgi:hypothetical protein